MKSLKKFNIKENRDNILKYGLLVLLFAQCLAIFLFNLLQTEDYLFLDNALAIRHGVEMWRNGLFLDGYHYYSTMEIDNAAFFAVPLYFLTGNLGLSLGIIHVILYVICAFLIYSVFKNAGYDTKYGFLATFLLFTPFVIQGLDWGNMLFITVGQYQFRVMVMLSMTNLMLMAMNHKAEKKKFIPIFVFHLLLCIWTTLSCGNYVLLMIVFPFCLFYIFTLCISEKAELNKTALIILASSVLVCIVTFIIRNQLIGETSRESLPLLTADTFTANLLNCVTGFFMLFGGLTQEPDVAIFSMKGILKIIKFVLILGCLLITWMKFKKIKRNDYLHYMFAFVALVNLMVMLLAVTRYGADIYEYRYHIVWGAMLLPVAVASLDAITYPRLRKVVLAVVVCMVAFINIGGFDKIPEETHGTDYVRGIIDVAEQENLDTIYVYNMLDEAAAIRALDLDKSCMSVTYVIDHVYTSTDNFYTDYSMYYTYDEKHLFVCSQECFEPLPEDIKACYTQIGELGENCLFVGTENPWLW
ncbi:MAG: hypothetical protein IJ397_06455 [Lachnospiraceae bacterium]|nr:hypothetical protein [Lachnospiraceae bacterium]